jgi:YjbE family integral membrane protein
MPFATDISSELAALFTVIGIDLILAGDNAIVIAMAAAGLPTELRQRAIVIGIGAAAVLRILFASITAQLLTVFWMMLGGGLLLLWVAWKLWREIRRANAHAQAPHIGAIDATIDRPGEGLVPAFADGRVVAAPAPKTFASALGQIVVADVSMSLDNVLAVAGAARHHLWVLVVGLALSVAFMGVAATYIARLLKRYPWITYFGLALIAWVAVKMIWDGGHEVLTVAREAKVFPF